MLWDFLGGLDGKEFAYNAGDLGSIPGSGRSPGEGNGNPLQYSCLENPMDRGHWKATVHGVAWGHRYHLSKFHIYVLVYCIVLVFFFLAYFTLYNRFHFHPSH